MESLSNLAQGFAVALTFHNLAFVLIGVLVGTTFGAFPGLNAATAIALLLPLTFSLDPTSAVIMLCGIYYGSQYGNSIAAVLLGIPGDSAAVLTSIEGHKLALSGRAGHALTLSAVSSFVGSIIGVVLIAVASPILADVALSFGPAEYFAVVLLGFATLPAFADEGRIKLLVSLGMGLALGVVGQDSTTATERFTFGTTELLSGIPFVAAIIGLFGIADIFYLCGKQDSDSSRPRAPKLKELFPAWTDWIFARWAMLRGSIVGFMIGVLPGAGATIASFTTYALERQLARDKTGFGQGRIDGLAAAEAGNNGAAIGAMVPLLTLGIPGSTSTAIMFGGFLIWGLQPGPQLFQNNPEFVWGLIASMLIGNVALLIICVTMIPMFALTLRIPFSILAPLVIVFCSFGTYSVNTSFADVWIMFAFGVLGYVMRLVRLPVAPMVLGLVLQPILESKLRLALTLAGGDLMVFVERPITAGLLAVAFLLFFGPVLFKAGRLWSMSRTTSQL